MNTWQSLLEPFGATWQAEQLAGFTDATEQASIALVPMIDYKLLIVEGKDSETFLQGQLTCDITRLTQGEHILGAHCNAKGRMISSMQVFRLGENCIGLRIHANLVDQAFAAIKKYIVFSKASLTVSDYIGLAIVNTDKTSGFQSPIAPDLAPGHVLLQEDCYFLRHNHWLEVWAKNLDIAKLSNQCRASLALPKVLEQELIADGIAHIQGNTSEEFIPQMFNYDIIDGISFKKGCYTGQEIVARLHYRGQAKKRTYTVEVTGALVGDEVVSAEKPEQSVGTIVAAAPHTALVCLSTELSGSEDPPLHIRGKNQAILKWPPQPYAIP